MGSSGWQLDEAGARAYERTIVPVFTDPWAADLLDAVEVKPGERVLDVGCGTGIVARHAARRVGVSGSVAGADINAAMLAVARELTDDLDPPIEFHQAPADALPFPDGSFDAVLSQAVLQFVPEPAAALAELQRVLRPGGRLGLITHRPIEHQPGYRALAAVVTRHVGVEAGEVLRSPYTLGDGERLRALVTGAGFAEVRVRIHVTEVRFPSTQELLRAETSSSPLGDLIDRLDADVRAALLDDVAGALRPHTDDGGVIFPFETMWVTAVRG